MAGGSLADLNYGRSVGFSASPRRPLGRAPRAVIMDGSGLLSRADLPSELLLDEIERTLGRRRFGIGYGSKAPPKPHGTCGPQEFRSPPSSPAWRSVTRRRSSAYSLEPPRYTHRQLSGSA